ncbi:hypothetical protein D918_05749 [Trichuris suis]|nr:hypothetical protein D918_05749 [Trichuris suis]
MFIALIGPGSRRSRIYRFVKVVLVHHPQQLRSRSVGTRHLLSVDHAEAVNEILASMEINSACVGAKLSDQDNSAMPDWIEERPCGRDDKLPSLSKETSENGKHFDVAKSGLNDSC